MKFLTLQERVDVVKKHEKGTSCRQLASEFGVGKTQIQNTIKRKAEIMTEFENAEPPTKKRKGRTTGNEDLNELLLKWFLDATHRRINVTGPMLQERALKFAHDLGLSEFRASNGWLESFRKRNSIACGKLCGESGDVDGNVVKSWKDTLPELCQGYEPRNIFNMDETGLFFKTSSDSSMFVKGEKCGGGKKAKDRITIAVCANMVGEKEELLVIGKSARPRAFKHIDIQNLPVNYKFSKKAWMNREICTAWLRKLDDRMRRQNRNILLFMDNAPSHPVVELTNTKLCFFPPKTTSVLQPMDQGVIQTLKLKYRKLQLSHMIAQMEVDKASTGTELMSKVNILDAIHWVSSAWKNVEPSTIKKCFKHSGFQIDVDEESPDDESAPSDIDQVCQATLGVPFQDVLSLDSNVQTSEGAISSQLWSQPASTILAELNTASQMTENEDESEDDNEEEKESDPKMTKATALSHLHNLAKFLKASNLTQGVEMTQDIEKMVLVINDSKQSLIHDFFSKK